MTKELFTIEGKVAVVTGGTGILCGTIAEALGKAGVKVGILGRNEKVAEERVKEIKEAGGEAIALIADVLDREALEEASKKIIEAYGKIDILINGAGGNMPGATVQPHESFLDLSFDDLRKVVDLNQLGTILPTQVFLKNMIERKEGCVINITSMAAMKPMTRVVGYAASKAAMNNFTEWLAIEMAHKYGEKIRVNAIAPGFFITEQNHSLLLKENGEYTDRANTIVKNTPMGRFGKPEELIGATIWLCSDAAQFVTGVVIPVDGGFNAFSGV